MKIINGGVNAAQGFQAAATAAQIKYENRNDMAMIYSQRPAKVAGTFTKNVVQAAPVWWDKKQIETEPYAHAVVVNAGIANACTGQMGQLNCEQTAAYAAQSLQVKKEHILVASTGVIGMQLPLERIKAGISKLTLELASDHNSAHRAAQAIMTTDTKEKEIAVSFSLGDTVVTLGGMCKGSGMIHPNMGTMLSFLTTDIAISKELLQEALREDVSDTYNMVSIDGDTSTNDTVLLMANGMAQNPEITTKDAAYQKFQQALRLVNESLARQIAGDGEGATALFETKIIHCDTTANAKLLAKSVIGSSLTKAAIFGHDANWGRILCALGYSGAAFEPDHLEMFFQSKAGQILIYKDGTAVDYSESAAAQILSEPEVTVLIDLKNGQAKATAWGCDLTYDYVKINADYRS
jgi:glutamate N-acetyltransferase/amino-acid N-acetyltransferase